MQALSSLLHDQRRVKEIRIGKIFLDKDFNKINFTHPSVMSLLQSLQDVDIYSRGVISDDDSDLQEQEPLTKVSSIMIDRYNGVSLYYLNLPNLTKLEIINMGEVIPKIERIP